MLKAMMPKMLQEIKEAYVNTTGKAPRPWTMCGYPPSKILCRRATDKEEEYHLIVGKQMYYMTEVKPDITNVVRELAGR